MSIQQELLDILCCPETKESVYQIQPDILAKVNQGIQSGKVRSRNGDIIDERIDNGLIRSDGKYLYPIRKGIPIMLIDAAIDMSTVNETVKKGLAAPEQLI